MAGVEEALRADDVVSEPGVDVVLVDEEVEPSETGGAVRREPPFTAVQAAIAVVAYSMLALGRGVDNTWDLQHYHLATGWSALHGHLPSPDWVVGGSMSFFNPVLDMLYAGLAGIDPWLAHGVLSIPPLVSCVVMVYLLRDIWPTTGAVASWVRVALAMLAVLGTDAIGQIGGTMADLTLTLPIVLGVFLVNRAVGALTDRRRAALIAGCACFGLAMGLKVTLIPVSVGLCVGALAAVAVVVRYESRSPDQPPPIRFRHVFAGFAIGWGTTGLLWSLYLWKTVGNPIFPFMNDLFRSEWAATESWSTPYHLSVLDLVVFPVRAALIEGAHYVSPYRFVEPRFAIGLLGVFLAGWSLVRERRRQGKWVSPVCPPTTVLLVGGWLVAYLLWAFLLANSRYAIPLIALSVPCLMLGIRSLNPGLERQPPASELAVVVVVGLLAATMAGVIVRGVPEWGPRTTDPQQSWTFPDGPESDQRLPELAQWKWQDVVIISNRWPLGFMIIELSPRNVWNLRESVTGGVEETLFARRAAEQIDRTGSIVAYDPRFYDHASITRKLDRWLDGDVELVECGVFENGWTPAQVCRFTVTERPDEGPNQPH